MKSLFQKPMRWLFWLALTLCLSGCAIGQDKKVEHGFDVHFGPGQNITSMVVRYGDFSREFCGGQHGCRTGYGSLYGVYMPIQPEMQVSWKTADGQQHQATVPVRAKVKDLQRLSSITLRFKGDQLEVQQWLHYANPSILEFEKLPLYP